MNVTWEEILSKLKNFGFKALFFLIVSLVVFLLAKLILFIISKCTKKIIDKEEKKDDDNSKKIITTLTVIRSVLRYVIYAIAIIVLLDIVGYGDSVNNIILTAGIGGLIISLGAQSFIKDLISGFFILFERQYSVGDYVEIAGKEGKVTAISIRSTYLDYRGQKIIIPNGQVTNVVNYNSNYNVFRFVVPTPYEKDVKDIIKLLSKILKDYYKKNADIFIEEPEVLGVTNYNIHSVDITVQGKCKTLKHREAERELRLLIKEAFDKEGIEMPHMNNRG